MLNEIRPKSNTKPQKQKIRNSGGNPKKGVTPFLGAAKK